MEMNQHSELYLVQYLSTRILMRIQESRTEGELKAILEDSEIKDFVMNKNRYHQMNLTITSDQLQSYFVSGLLRKDGSIDETKIELESTTTKLLYALLWKQGDLQKVKYIVQGISGDQPVPESGMVLYYFGKHLADKKQPIIDQHVIRAHAVASNKSRFNEDILTKKDLENIKSYIEWFQHSLPPEMSSSQDCRYVVDQVLYALGKRIKREISILYPRIYANG